jgi:hypothetical protein
MAVKFEKIIHGRNNMNIKRFCMGRRDRKTTRMDAILEDAEDGMRRRAAGRTLTL